MFDNFKAVLDSVETSADLSVVLLFGSLGFTVDAVLNVVGVMSPGTVGAVSASSALGVKKGIDAYLKRKRFSDDEQALRLETRSRAERMVEFFGNEGYGDGQNFMRRQCVLHEEGIIGDEELRVAMDEARGFFLDWARRQP